MTNAGPIPTTSPCPTFTLIHTPTHNTLTQFLTERHKPTTLSDNYSPPQPYYRHYRQTSLSGQLQVHSHSFRPLSRVSAFSSTPKTSVSIDNTSITNYSRPSAARYSTFIHRRGHDCISSLPSPSWVTPPTIPQVPSAPTHPQTGQRHKETSAETYVFFRRQL